MLEAFKTNVISLISKNTDELSTAFAIMAARLEKVYKNLGIDDDE